MQNAAMYHVIQGLLWLWVRLQGIKLEKTWKLHVQERSGPEQMTQITHIVAAMRWLYFLSHNLTACLKYKHNPALSFTPTCQFWAASQVYLSRNISKEILSPCHQHSLFISAVTTPLINNYYTMFLSNSLKLWIPRTYHHKQENGYIK